MLCTVAGLGCGDSGRDRDSRVAPHLPGDADTGDTASPPLSCGGVQSADPGDVQAPIAHYSGPVAYQLAFDGDPDGDGCSDLFMGSPYLSREGGVIHRATAGGSDPIVVRAGWPGQLTGFSLHVGGDLTGDDVVDMVVGSADLGGPGHGGDVAIYPGSPGGIQLIAPAAALLGDDDRQVGFSVATGPADDDGALDLAVSSRRPGGLEVWLFRGPLPARFGFGDALATVYTRGEGGILGNGIDLVDLDGDGAAELVAGAPNLYDGLGAVLVFAGPVTGALAGLAADGAWVGEQGAGPVGVYARGAGDVDGDGVGDVVVGVPNDDEGAEDAGAVYLVSGLPAGEWGLSAARGKRFHDGYRASAGNTAACGDVDGDGHADVLVTGPGSDELVVDEGAAWLLLGPWDGVAAIDTAARSWAGPQQGGLLGMAVACGQDFDGDGSADAALGAPGTRDVYLFPLP